jgi:hypothetical protein
MIRLNLSWAMALTAMPGPMCKGVKGIRFPLIRQKLRLLTNQNFELAIFEASGQL